MPQKDPVKRTSYYKAYAAKNAEKLKANRRKYYLANKEKILEVNRAYQKNNAETINTYNRTYRITHPLNKELTRAKQKVWRANNPEKVLNQRLKNLYGISVAQYNELLEKQKYCCKLCLRHQDLLPKKLYIDHDHKTGKVRGLLCQKCNTTLGRFDDDTQFLTRAINYLNNE